MRTGTIGRGLGLATALAALLTGVFMAPASAGRAAPDQAPAAALAAAPAAFTHPGVLVSRPQLDFVRAKVQAGAQPWKSAYDQMMGSKYASLGRTAKPRAVVECGSYSNPNYGCTDEREDAIAAYTLSLAWYITQDSRYAVKAVEIMDAWSAVIKDHTNSNAPCRPAGQAPPGRVPPRSSSTPTAAGRTRAASPPCCVPSTSRRSSTARTATATGN